MFPSRKIKASSKVLTYVQSRPADSSAYYTDSQPCTVSLRAGPCEPVAFVLGRMVLHWGNTLAIMCKCRGLSRQMYEQ